MCGGDRVVLSRRAPALVRWIARCFSRRQYRCMECLCRFWDRSGFTPQRTAEQSLAYEGRSGRT